MTPVRIRGVWDWLWAVPDLPDPVEARRARLVQQVLRFIVGATTTVFALALVAPGGRPASVLLVYGPFSLVLLALVSVFRSGYVKASALAVAGAVFAFVAAVVFLFGGLGANNGVAWTVSAMLAGALIGRRAALGFAAASAALAGLAAVAEIQGWLPPSLGPMTPANAWIALTVTTFLVVGLHNLAVASLDTALQATAEAFARLRTTSHENETRAAQGASLAGLAERALSAPTLSSFGNDVAEGLSAVLDADRVVVVAVDQGSAAQVVGIAGATLSEVELAAAALPAGEVALSDPAAASLAASLGLRGLAGWVVGARGRDRVLGAIVVTLPEGRVLTAPESTYLRAAAGLVAGFVERERARERALRAQKMEIVGRLAGGIAHDFNNLLSAVVGISEDLRQSDAPAALLDDLDLAADRAALLTRQLLAFSRRGPERREILDLGKLVSAFGPMARRLVGGEIDVSIEVGAAPSPVLGDRAQLEQLILNLVVNARDAMPRGGKLRLEVVPGPAGARLRVADSGVGMDEGTRARIFELFFSTKPDGTGLGLATVRDIVDRHEGTIHVDSTVGAGTVFTVAFPSAIARAAPGRTPSSVPPLLVRHRVLLAEDHDLVRASTARMLVRLGHEVVAVSDGAQALARIQGGERFDLLVSDVAMPELNGHELVAALDGLGLRPPTVLVSGHHDRLPVTAVPGAAALRWLAKPFTATQLAEAMAACSARQDAPPRS